MENQRSSHISSFLSLPHVTTNGLSLAHILWALAAVIVIVPVYFTSKNRRPLPPGPRRWPILGNATQIPKEKEWLVYTEWSKTYGHIMSLTAFGQTLVILNSSKAALDLLQKRSSIYSDRPTLPFAGEMVGWELSLALTHYGEHFRQIRRLTHQILSPRPVQAFWPAEEEEAAKFLNRLLQTPENFADHIRDMVGAVVLKITYGYTVSDDGNDPLVLLAGKVMEEFSIASKPGAFWVDLLPWLKYAPSWLPGAGFLRKGTEWRNNLLQMADTAHKFTKAQMGSPIQRFVSGENDVAFQEMGTAIPSFTSNLLQGKYTDDEEYLVKWTGFSIYAGGADTTVAAITTFFLAMCHYPRVQVAAQAELDAVIGRDRLPNVNDRASLPYIEAVLKEVLRWGPVAPMGVPHRVMQEDIYDGYRIPEGSIVITNIWAMTHNPDLFPQPNEFRPERYTGTNKTDADPLETVFGFGRRICPGQYLAEPSLYLAIARTLSMFTISNSSNKFSGKILELTDAWRPGTISHPVPFGCKIKPRSAHAVNVIKQAVVTRKE